MSSQRLSFDQRISDALCARERAGLERKITRVQGGNLPIITVDGTGYSNFSSNDYMGLAGSPELAQAWKEGIGLYGAGSGASPLVTGFSPAHQMLEDKLCNWLGYDRAVLFGSGFSANQAVLFSLLDKQDTLLQDRLNHASLMEAGMLSPATMKRFRHNDPQHLDSLLKPGKNPPAVRENTLVVTEGVFSMDGDLAPLREISGILSGSDNWLMVDDAHGIGVLGDRGAGSCQLAGIKPQILVVTFGKAFGLSGAAVLCDQATGSYLTQFARHHVYSTAIPPGQAYALANAAEMLMTQEWRREKVLELQDLYNSILSDSKGFVATDTPIKPFICGSADKAMRFAAQLKDAGFWVTAIRPPTVPKESSRIRITLTANHSAEQVANLANKIREISDNEL